MDSQGFGFNCPSVVQNSTTLQHHNLQPQMPKSTTGREEFGGLDNETLDFSQLEDFITDESDANGSYFADTLANSEASKHAGGPPLTPRIVVLTQGQNGDHGFLRKGSQHLAGPPAAFPSAHLPHNLPDSPPDSGSEPPYSPTDPGSRSPHSKPGTLNGGPRSIHDLLIHHPIFPQNGSLPLGSHDLPPMTSPLPHLTPLRGPTLIPITPSPGNPNSSPTTLTTLGPPQPTHILIQHGAGGGQVTQQQQSSLDITPPFYSPIQSVEPENTRSRKRKSSTGSSSPGRKCNVKQEPSGAVPSFSELSPSDSNASNHNVNGNSNSGHADEEFGFDFSGDPSVFLDSNYQCIKFQPFQESSWHVLADENFKELGMPYYKVDADKGFNFSNADDAFVCQKKNHFQVTCHARQNGEPKYVKTPEGFKLVDDYFIHFYGVKVESQNQTIKIEQSQSDRSKKPFHPVIVDLTHDHTAKVTVGRLHFNETTSNNMRKKGKPNPDQRYFFLVVALHAHCSDGTYPIIAHASQRIIVRASNPGQFESDMELTWQKGQTSESVYHAGRVGINTDRPDEALVIYGNCKVTGQITHPSDARAKHDICEIDTKEQLENVQKLRVVRYKYNPEFARLVGLPEEEAVDTGVIAQEVQKVIPEAVKETGDLELTNGTFIPNFLVVNKERIFMENIGAVKELCKVTGKLETRIDELEKLNNLKFNVARHGSMKCESSGETSSHSRSKRRVNLSRSSSFTSRSTEFLCSNRAIQIVIFGLVVIMALSLAAMATLYVLDYHKRSTLGIYHQPINSTPPVIKMSDSGGYLASESQRGEKIVSSKAHDPLGVVSRSPIQLSGQANLKIHSKAYQKEQLMQQTWVNPLKHPMHEQVQSPPHAKPAVLGRPQKCPVYLTLSPCKVYCCPGIDLSETSLGQEYLERGNQVSSTSGSSGASVDFLVGMNHTVDGAPLISGNLMQRNGLEYKRRRRQVHDISRLLNVPSIHLQSEHINQSLDSSYCMTNSEGYHDCVSTENKYFANANLTYGVPLSKYWDGLSLSLIFNISSKFDVTQPEICKKVLPQHICSLNPEYADENKVHTEPSTPPASVTMLERNIYSVNLHVGTSPFSKVTLRFSTDLQHTDVCSLHSSTAKLFEFTFYFYRVCEE